jgi:hypothetical protein
MSLNGAPKYNQKGVKEYIKDTSRDLGKKAALEQFNLIRDTEVFKEYEKERKEKLKEQDEKYLVGLNSKKTEIKQEPVKQQESLGFKSIENKIKEAIKFSEGNQESNFSVSEFNELAKEVYTIKDENVRNKFAEELINIQTRINTQNSLVKEIPNEYVGAYSNTTTGAISQRDIKTGKFTTLSEGLKQESKDQIDLLNYSKNIKYKLDPNLVNPLEKFKRNKNEKENEIEKLSKKGVGITWPTQNKKVASYIERLFTADLSKGEHWDLVKEFGKDLGRKGSEYLITTPFGIEKNRKKIKDEIEKVMDYPGFEELIKNDKFMKKSQIKRPYQLSSLFEKLQNPGFDLFKEEQDKLKNEEKKIIKKAIDIFNYYKTTPEYLDDKHEDEEEKADKEGRKENKKLSKTLNRLASSINKEDLKKKKRDIQGIREKADFRNFIETLEKSSGLAVFDDEEYKEFIDRTLTKIREDNLLSRSQVRDIEDYISKSKAA